MYTPAVDLIEESNFDRFFSEKLGLFSTQLITRYLNKSTQLKPPICDAG